MGGAVLGSAPPTDCERSEKGSPPIAAKGSAAAAGGGAESAANGSFAAAAGAGAAADRSVSAAKGSMAALLLPAARVGAEAAGAGVGAEAAGAGAGAGAEGVGLRIAPGAPGGASLNPPSPPLALALDIQLGLALLPSAAAPGFFSAIVMVSPCLSDRSTFGAAAYDASALAASSFSRSASRACFSCSPSATLKSKEWLRSEKPRPTKAWRPPSPWMRSTKYRELSCASKMVCVRLPATYCAAEAWHHTTAPGTRAPPSRSANAHASACHATASACAR